MSILDRMKLNKLKITAYNMRDRSRPRLIGSFEAMFNPASLSQKYEVQYDCQQGVGSSDGERRYIRNKPRELDLKLILDGTGVSAPGPALRHKQTPVARQVEQFLQLTFHRNEEIHEPNFLTLEWGDLTFWGSSKFNCRLVSVDISYTGFKRDGTALRAELEVKLVSDEEHTKRLAQENSNSPDLTHRRIVKSGDTLPWLCREIYGQAAYYLRVAQANNLDDFRELTPGQELFFPPLAR